MTFSRHFQVIRKQAMYLHLLALGYNVYCPLVSMICKVLSVNSCFRVLNKFISIDRIDLFSPALHTLRLMFHLFISHLSLVFLYIYSLSASVHDAPFHNFCWSHNMLPQNFCGRFWRFHHYLTYDILVRYAQNSFHGSYHKFLFSFAWFLMHFPTNYVKSLFNVFKDAITQPARDVPDPVVGRPRD